MLPAYDWGFVEQCVDAGEAHDLRLGPRNHGPQKARPALRKFGINPVPDGPRVVVPAQFADGSGEGNGTAELIGQRDEVLRPEIAALGEDF